MTSIADLRRLTPDLRGLGDIRLVTIDNGPGRGQRMLLMRNASGIGFEVAVDRGFDPGALTFRGINIGWNAPTRMPAPPFPHDAEDGLGMLRSLDGLLATCGLDHYGLPVTGPSRHLAYANRQCIQYPLHGRISGQPATLIGYGMTEGDAPVLWCEAEVRQSAVFAEVLVLRRRIELALVGDTISIVDRVTNAGFRPARHGVLYHCNIGYPLLDHDSEPTGVLTTMRTAWDERPPRPDPDAEEMVDAIALDASPDIVEAGLHNPRLNMGFTLRFRRSQLPGLALWRCWQSGIFVLGIEPNSALGGDQLDPDTSPEAFLAAGETRDYALEFILS